MPLTPQAVRSKRFTPVRFREGYDMAEVDRFLDEVEAELERLAKESEQPSSQVPVEDREDAKPPAAPAVAVSRQPDSGATDSGATDSATSSATDGGPDGAPDGATGGATGGVEPSPPDTEPADGSAGSRAARLLEIATRNADELVAETQAEAEALLARARAEAAQLTDDARRAADELGAETERSREEMLGELDRRKRGLGAEIDQLRAFEREYRSRLREYLTAQLATLDDEEAEAASLPSTIGGQDGQGSA